VVGSFGEKRERNGGGGGGKENPFLKIKVGKSLEGRGKCSIDGETLSGSKNQNEGVKLIGEKGGKEGRTDGV